MDMRPARPVSVLLAAVAIALAASFVVSGASQRATLAPSADTTIRERRAVTRAATQETWELRWRSTPSLVCTPDEPLWITCPCHGFEFGEAGDLEVVRRRNGRDVDRLHLTPLFAGRNQPGWETGMAALRRWPELPADRDAFIKADPDERELAAFARAVTTRGSVSVLAMHDYNGDGAATEFLLNVGTLGCGEPEAMVVGISDKHPTLHPFGTAEHPDTPLVLRRMQWDQLRTSNPYRAVTWQCRGPEEEQVEVAISVDEKGIHAREKRFACDRSGRGRQLSSRIL